MKLFRFLLLFLCCLSSAITILSCNDNDEKRQAETLKDAQKQEVIFNTISKGWNFSNPILTPSSQTIVNNWNEWRLFLDELGVKPKSTIGAFQKKAKALSKRASDLNANIPYTFNKPEVKSRIAVLVTKINAINLFINLDDIPAQKVVSLVADVNEEMHSLTRQMDEIIRKNAIPKEEGESDMLRMLDTARAIPNKIVPQP